MILHHGRDRKKVKLYDRFDGVLVGHLLDISLNDISRKLIGGEAVVSGVTMALIWALFTLYFYSIDLSDSPRPYRTPDAVE